MFKKSKKADASCVRFHVKLNETLDVELLVTPRLYMVADMQGIDLHKEMKTAADVMALSSDLMFCAALNAWQLGGNLVTKPPFTLVDFHSLCFSAPEEYKRSAEQTMTALRYCMENMTSLFTSK